MEQIKTIEQVVEYVRSLEKVMDSQYEQFDNATIYADKFSEMRYYNLSSEDKVYLSAVRDVFEVFDEIASKLNDLYEKISPIEPLEQYLMEDGENEDC